tara:strand:+ start:2822 stop:3541 length:720 start_codon:yes stop_codon:yes gene_type:complete
MKLLTVSGNPKLIKGDKLSDKYLSAIMHLSPINTRICPYQDIAKCKEACLNTAGRGGIFKKGETTNVIQEARKRKTNLFLDDRDTFMQLLVKDIQAFIRKCDRLGKLPCIRLNGTSDIQWEYIEIDGHDNIFAMFPEVQFYDYTKIPTRKVSHIKNYHLTWSYSEANDKYAKLFDKVPYNKAVVFNGALPSMFKELKVIDGDKTDMRFLDEPNSVVGLKAKGKARQDKSGFVINIIQLA